MDFRREGRHITLRDWHSEDLPVYREWLRPHHDWHLWDGPYFPRPSEFQADALVAELARQVAMQEWPRPRKRVVIADNGTDRLLGVVSWHWESEATNWRRAGITVYDPETRGRGIGTEALALWTTYLFEITDIRRLDYSTWSGNEAMCKVGRKLRWTQEARFRDARLVRGEVYDSVVYGVTRGQWERRK